MKIQTLQEEPSRPASITEYSDELGGYEKPFEIGYIG